jgi:hypothetical protein
MNKVGYLHNTILRPLGDVMLDVTSSFEHTTFTHIFRELNQDIDKLLKEGHISWEEVKDGVYNSSMSTLGVGLV